jgi:hypothetical protein
MPLDESRNTASGFNVHQAVLIDEDNMSLVTGVFGWTRVAAYRVRQTVIPIQFCFDLVSIYIQ